MCVATKAPTLNSPSACCSSISNSAPFVSLVVDMLEQTGDARTTGLGARAQLKVHERFVWMDGEGRWRGAVLRSIASAQRRRPCSAPRVLHAYTRRLREIQCSQHVRIAEQARAFVCCVALPLAGAEGERPVPCAWVLAAAPLIECQRARPDLARARCSFAIFSVQGQRSTR